MREVTIARMEYLEVTGAIVIQCPRGIAKLPIEVVEAAGND